MVLINSTQPLRVEKPNVKAKPIHMSKIYMRIDEIKQNAHTVAMRLLDICPKKATINKLRLNIRD